MAECTCFMGHAHEHIPVDHGGEGNCPCTTPVMECAVHADSPFGQAERAAIGGNWYDSRRQAKDGRHHAR